MAARTNAQRAVPLPYAERNAEAVASLPGSHLPWLRSLREESLARFRQEGLPTIRQEAWKYTNLNRLAQAELAAANDAQPRTPDSLPMPLASGPRLVFVDGWFAPQLSTRADLPAGLTLASTAEMLARDPALLAAHLADAGNAPDRPLVALNTAFMADGFVLRVAQDAALPGPVELLFLGGAGGAVAYHPRNLIIAEPGSHATLVERHLGSGDGQYWSNPVTQVVVRQGATLAHCKVQEEAPGAIHLAFVMAEVQASGSYEAFLFSIGAGLARHEVHATLAGRGAACRLDGAYLARGRQHVDNTTQILHAQPETRSRQVYKGVLDEDARGVFQGRVVVAEDAQKSDGHQLSRTLLLGDRAEIDAKPELEIYADDVKCSHGATAGALDENAMFYLRARGLDPAAARRLLIEGFIGDLLDEQACDAARVAARIAVSDWLAQSFGSAA